MLTTILLSLACMQSQMSVSDVAERLAEWEADRQRYETTIEMRIYETHPAGEDAHDPEKWAAFRRVHLLVYGGRLRMEIVGRDADAPETEFRDVYVWDGEQFISRMHGDRGIVIRPRFQWPPGGRLLSMVTGIGSDSIPGTSPLSDLIRRLEIRDEQREGNTVRLRMEPESSSAESPVSMEYQLELLRGAEGVYPQQLRQIATRSGDRAEVIASEEWRILEWTEVDGLRVPQRADRRVNRVVEGQEVSGLVTFRCLSARRLKAPPDPAVFTLSARDGEVVSDERINMTFEVGGEKLWIDGAVYQLSSPIWEHPQQDLADYLRDAKLLHSVSGGGSIPSPDPYGEFWIVTAVIAGITCMAASTIAVALRRRRQGAFIPK